MITIDIPGRDTIQVEHVVLDYNGTIAKDGVLLPEIRQRLQQLKGMANIYILTADTYGTVAAQCKTMEAEVRTFPQERAAQRKAEIVRKLGGNTFCAGNGYNDIAMFQEASLAVGIIDREGMCAALALHADILVTSAQDALDLLLKPDRLRATLRS